MRVATRRLRAALSLFEGVLPVRAQVFRDELGWLGRLLGAVRDLDVQLEGLADMAARRRLAHTAARRPRPPGRTVGAPRARARRGPRRHVERARLGPLGAPGQGADRHGAAGTGAPLARHPGARRHRPARAGAGAPRQGGKAAKRAKRSGVVTDFHALRIRCKRLRYALEFGGEVYGGRTSRFVRAAHGAAGRARRNAGRRGGVAPTGRPGHRRRPPARRHHLHDGRRGRAAPARGAAATSNACPASCSRVDGRAVARAARSHGAPSGRGGGGAAAGAHARCAPCPSRRPTRARAGDVGRTAAPAPRSTRRLIPAPAPRAHRPWTPPPQSGQGE